MPYDARDLTVVYNDYQHPIAVRACDRPNSAFCLPLIIDQQAGPWNLTGTAAETVLATCTIPGGLVGPHGSIEVSYLFTSTNSANTKTYRVKLGTTTTMAFTATTNPTVRGFSEVHNVTETAQRLTGTLHNGSAFPANTATTSIGAAIDTRADVVVQITGQLATTTETITLEHWRVVVYPNF